jgi:hypothetical protein
VRGTLADRERVDDHLERKLEQQFKIQLEVKYSLLSSDHVRVVGEVSSKPALAP